MTITKNYLKGFSLLVLSIALCCVGHAQEPTEEEMAFAQRIYHLQEIGDEEGFLQAEQAFMDYLEKKGDWAKYYNVWMNKVVYDVNEKKFYRAYTEIRKITDDIRERNKPMYLYIPHQALGFYYVNKSNPEMGAQQFMKALEKIDTLNNKLAAANLYISLAQALSFTNPQQALRYLDKVEPMTRNPTTTSGILGYRCIITYEMGDEKAFDRYYSQYDSIRRQHPEEFNELNYDYVMVYLNMRLGNYQEALGWCDSVDARDEACELREKVYAKMGLWEKAYQEDTMKDSLRALQYNEVLIDDLNSLNHDIAVMDYALERAHARKIQIILVSLLSLAVIALLVGMLIYRHKKNLRLKRQYDELLLAQQRTKDALAIRKAFVGSLQERLTSPINLLLGFARAFNNPDFRLDVEDREKAYESITASAKSIESLLEPLLDSFVYNHNGIGHEQRQLCLDTLRSPLSAMIGMAEMIASDKAHSITEDDYMAMRSEISKDANQVATAVHELLVFSTSDEGAEVVKGDLVGLNESALSSLSAYDLRNTNLRTQFSTNVDYDVRIATNQDMLHELLMTLISNADKYATGGVIWMYCYQEPAGTYAISLVNDAPAIGAEDAKRIFEPFVRLSEDGKGYGLGLGLPLARRLARMLGYELILDSDYQDGVKFVITGIVRA